MPKATRFVKPSYLTRDDVMGMSAKDRVFEIDHISVEYIAREERLVLYSDSLPKPLPLNSTNIASLIEICATEDTDEWRGHRVEVYVDASVMYADRRVGGIRLRGAK